MKKLWLTIGDQEPAAGRPREYLCAESYDDLPKRQCLAVLRVAYTQPRTIESRLAVLHLASTIPLNLARALCQSIHRDELQRILECLDWAWTTGVQKQPFPAFKYKGATYLLPDEDLRQVSTGEYITAIAYLLMFSDSHSTTSGQTKEQYLNQFMATICRPKVSLTKRLMRDRSSYTGDDREPFNSYFIDSRATRFSSVDVAIKASILQWFMAAVGRVEMLYGMPSPEPSEKKAVLHTGAFVRDWEQTVHYLAREGNFGNYDSVMERSIHDVLGYLELKKSEGDDESHE